MKLGTLFLHLTFAILLVTSTSTGESKGDQQISKKTIEEIVPDPVFRRVLLGSKQSFYQRPALLDIKAMKKITNLNMISDYEAKITYYGSHFVDKILDKNKINKLAKEHPEKTELDLTGLQHLSAMKKLTLSHFKSYKAPQLDSERFPVLEEVVICDCDVLPFKLLALPAKKFSTNVNLDEKNIEWLSANKSIVDFTLMITQRVDLPKKLYMPSVKKLRLNAYLCSFTLAGLFGEVNRAFPNIEELQLYYTHRIYMPQNPMELIARSMPNIERIKFATEILPFMPFLRYSSGEELKNFFRDSTLIIPNNNQQIVRAVPKMYNMKYLGIRISSKNELILNNEMEKLLKVSFISETLNFPKVKESFFNNCPNLKELNIVSEL